MTLTKTNYDNLCKTVGIPQAKRNFAGFTQCDILYNAYFSKVIARLKRRDYQKIIILFLESCPAKTSNYIFDSPKGVIDYPADGYLWNIYSGFFSSSPKRYSKEKCLDDLLEYKSKTGLNVPVIIMDLFPFHGISLNSDIRIEICKNIGGRFILDDTIKYLKDIDAIIDQETKKLFLFGLPYTLWNYMGGFGNGSLYSHYSSKTGLLRNFDNETVVMNVGGQNISSKAIEYWRFNESVE